MTWWLWFALLAGVLAIVAVALTVLGERRWAAATRALTRALEAAAADDAPPRPTRYDARELEGLPAPVQRYFRTVLKDGQPLITAVTVAMAGRFNLSPTGEQWKPFTSRQRVLTRRPGFVWDARIGLLPGVGVRVIDSYCAGQGLLHAAVQGLFTVAEVHGDGEIARGEFMRWFAEVAWYPTALLPSQGVRWEAVDDRSANATLADGPLTLSLLFRFDDDGRIGSFRAEARGGMVGKAIVMAPWEGRWSNYQTCDGMQVPFTGEVAWMRPDRRRPYFIGSITALHYEFAP